jgi:microcystin-dependent protein
VLELYVPLKKLFPPLENMRGPSVISIEERTERTNMTPTDQATPSSLPIGSIVCFAGDLSVAETREQLKAAGWLLCDGAELQQNEHPELFAAIGGSNGSAGEGRFNIPDLRDRFVRGRNGTAANDPDADARTAAQSGGATGNRVGSLQAPATALPVTTPFTLAKGGSHAHDVQHLTHESWPTWSGSTYDMAHNVTNRDTREAGSHSHALSGFEAATVPVNMTLYYVIKTVEPEAADGVIPAGTIAGFAGESSTAPQWLLCDGRSYGTTRFPSLNALISYNYGGDGVSVFNVPDLRGRFLRGTSHTTGRDPDAGTRVAPNTGGATGDSTGSVQKYATACPKSTVAGEAGEHAHNLPAVPHSNHNVALGASGFAAKYCVVWTDGSVTSATGGEHEHAVTGGGDRETRPVNVSADWLIASDNLRGAPPIGTIMPIGCDTTNIDNLGTLMDQGWLPCGGQRLKIADAKYEALYRVIGTTYGSVPLQFLLPDLRGYFVQGAGGKSKAGVVLNQSQTGAPAVTMTTTTAGSHTHGVDHVPTHGHRTDVVMGKVIAEWNPTDGSTQPGGRHTHTVSGGDKESRPANVYVDYVIRYR